MNENETTSETMADVSHTNPYTGETVGRLFSRGPTVVADGGEPSETRRTTEGRGSSGSERDATGSSERTDERSNDTMADVDHTPPQDAEDANRVFERGRDHPVEDEE
ncbi:hypothetical protein C477_10128 [Haloterrigena salina JCM 13891]|uniref:Uncharacterized protein n=1 Tax=Haloterrigena salina JCM 13891 TaxID=1227488 RepID=M0C7U8_9EURY|nr:hypothetical protein [Haloterrigena salina]ELZ18417.1 hypothetical protein C477_10128 [Haloterrigena salina JCM 13891]